MFCGFVVLVERCQKFLILLSKEPRVDVITSHNSFSLSPGMHFPGIPALVPKCQLFIAALASNMCLPTLGRCREGIFSYGVPQDAN